MLIIARMIEARAAMSIQLMRSPKIIAPLHANDWYYKESRAQLGQQET